MTENNLQIWDAVASPPDWAKKAITGGRLKGKTDINPQWRLRVMTEKFGPVGFGWGYTIERQWLEAGNGPEVRAFVNIHLWVKVDGEKSDPIPGTGGSSFVEQEKNGIYTNDEAFKMALTDALSVAMRALGVGAEVYSGFNSPDDYRYATKSEGGTITEVQEAELRKLAKEVGAEWPKFVAFLKVEDIKHLRSEHFDAAKKALEKRRSAA